MPDNFNNSAQSVLAPSESAYAVTPNDTTAMPSVPKYPYPGTGGDVALRTVDGSSDVLFKNVPDGGYIYARASHVRATGITATAIVACA